MSWELSFNAPVGKRIMKDCFSWVQVYVKNENQELMWNAFGSRGFDTSKNLKGAYTSSCMPGINSVRAFKRFLRKNGENIKCYEVILCSKYYVDDSDGNFLYDYSVKAEWKD